MKTSSDLNTSGNRYGNGAISYNGNGHSNGHSHSNGNGNGHGHGRPSSGKSDIDLLPFAEIFLRRWPLMESG